MDPLQKLEADARAAISEQETSLMGLVQRSAPDNFAAQCPNPSVLERCEAAGVLDRYNRVVGPHAEPSS